MRAAMAAAITGDDVYGEDPTVIQLEQLAARLTGKAAGLFVTSGTQANLLALLSHCDRGDEYIAGGDAHTYRYEAGGGAVLGGIQPQPLNFNDAGELPLAAISNAVKPDDFHFARTRLVCLENTIAGKVLSPGYLSEFAALINDLGLASHLDGARVFNAAVKLRLPVAQITAHFDSISFCLSKGLAAPVGSLLVGPEALIEKARRWRKMLGGGMRQAGILAAAGIYALEHHVERLADDHRRAAEFAGAIKELNTFALKAAPQTNMVMLNMPAERLARLRDYLAAASVTISGARLVFHRDIDDAALSQVIDLCRKFDAQY